MSTLNKEEIVRAVLELLSKSVNSPGGVGEMVLFLERDAESWIRGSFVDLNPLWEYCRGNGWQEEFFRDLVNSLQQRFVDREVQWMTPFGGTDAASLADDFASFSDSSTAGSPSNDMVVEWIIDGIRRSPVERIIDPEKLRGFLVEAMEEMRVQYALDLQLLWEVLLDADGVDEQMLLKAFLVMQIEKNKRGIALNVTYPSLVHNLPDSMRSSLLRSMGLSDTALEPEAEDPVAKYADAYAIKSRHNAPGGSRGSGSRAQTQERKQRAGAAKLPKTPNYASMDSPGLPRWIVWGGLACILVTVAMYFSFLYQPAPKWKGTVVASGPYKKLLSFSVIRKKNRTMNVRVTQRFLSLSETKRNERAYALWTALRRNHKIYTMVLFSPTGKVLTRFDSR